MTASALTIVYRDPAKLKAYGRNARTHSAEQIDQIRASIREFGFTNPILLKDDDETIGAGHGRWQAATAERMEQVPTITLRGLSEVQWRAYVIADNKIALNAGWNNELLKLELGELQAFNFNLSLTGFSLSELSLINATKGLVDPDDIPEPPKAPVSRAGDVWLLGATAKCPKCGKTTRVGIGK